jgi:hypothetical protein
MEVKVLTWEKESFGLFDFDSKTFGIQTLNFAGGDFSQQRWMDTAQNKKRSAIKLIIQSFRKLERKPREEQPA